MPGLTLAIGEKDRFEAYMATAEKALYNFMHKEPMSVDIYEMEQPDTLLWATWTIQQYAKYTSRKACYENMVSC